MLDRMGINVRNGALRTRNVAAVMVTADIPSFVTPGSRIDVSVSSLGDATSLMGGTLLMTALSGADGVIYAGAQGPVTVTGFAQSGQAEILTQGVPTAGHVPNGALVEREIAGAFDRGGPLALELTNPDFRTAVRIADAINAYTQQRYRRRFAHERDNRTVVVDKPYEIGAARYAADIGDLAIDVDAPARIVIDARSGTVVIGADVQISTVAVTHGTLTVRVTETPSVSQPAPRSRGTTTVVPQSQIIAEQDGGQVAIVSGANLRTLVRGLNQIGLKPSGIIAILQTIKAAGALQAELVVQ
jgi:flagellar P-ring protein precursor FlgI